MKPRIFIGSSVEGKYIADAIQANFEYFAWCTIWEHAFAPSQVTIDSLIKKASTTDFAIFVFSDDDIIKIRKQEKIITRDNVIFEAGLFMGELGKDRVFIVTPRGITDFHLLTDLSGFTPVTFESARAKIAGEVKPALASAANDIKDAINSSSWTLLKLKITPKTLLNTAINIHYPLKLEFIIENKNAYPVTIESINFKLDKNLKFAPNANEEQQKPLFCRIGMDGKHIYNKQITIEREDKVMSCWIPIDPLIGQDKLEKALEDREIGIWEYRCIWIKEHVVTCLYGQEF